MSPLEPKSEDTIKRGDSTFALILVPVIFGTLICSVFFALFIKNRKEEDIACSDWRFTGAFIFGCILLNLACLSFIGENTNGLCLLRMWLLPFCAVLALAPLLVKIYRLHLLDGRLGSRRQAISHRRTAMMAMSLVSVQVVLLLIFTFVDPMKQESQFLGDDMIAANYRVVCNHETKAFGITQLVYWTSLVVTGCILSFKTRNTKDFGESKQLIVVIYTVALVTLVIVLVSWLAIESLDTLRIFVTVGVCWITIFSTAVFVLPRLLKVRDRRRSNLI